MVLYFAADQNSNVTVSIPGVGYSQTYFVAANTVLTSNPIPKSGAQDVRLKAESSVAENKGIHITSDKPIVAYAHIYNSSISGASILFPTATLGKEYYSINYKNVSNAANANCWFYVVACDTGTTKVEITPSANTLSHPAGIPFTVDLQQGQIFNIMGELTSDVNPYTGVDLTGSKIQSISSGSGNCKRIAVFSGSGRISLTCNNSSSSSDNYMVQAFPKSAWGKKFLTAPTGGTSPNNIFRVCVSTPSAIVTLNGGPIGYPLINNFYYEIPITRSPLRIESTDPITVAQYLTSQGACGNGNPGDPEMIYLSPVEQNINKVLWNATPNFAITQHFYNLIIPNTGTAITSFRIDGATVPAGSFIPHPQAPGYSYYTGSVGAGQHTISSDSGFNAIAYGYGNAESYGYNAGTNIKDIYQYISVENQYATVNFPATCKNSPFYFSMTFPYQPTAIQWLFNGLFPNVSVNSPVPFATTTVNGRILYQYRLPTPYSVPTPGSYPIKVIAHNPTPDGCGGEQEIDFDLQVFEPPVADFNFTSNGCIANPVQFNDNSNSNGRTIANRYWNFGDNSTSSANNPSHTFTISGSYPVKYAIRTDVGCISDTVTKIVALNDLPVAKFGFRTPLCVGKTITFSDTSTATGSLTLVKWNWNFGDATPTVVATSNINQTHIYSTPGVYTVTLMVETNSGCSSTVFSKPVTISVNPVTNFNLPSVCLPAGAASFNNSSSISSGTIASYAWDFGNGNTSVLQNPINTYTSTGPYNVTLTATSDNGCTDTKTQLLNTIYPEPQAVFNAPAEVCTGTAVNFTENSTVITGTVTQWSWNFGDGNTSTIKNPVHTYVLPGVYTVTLYVVSDKGCQTVNNFATRTITVNALPTTTFSTSLPGCVSRSIIFSETSVANSGTLVKWNWNYGDGNTNVLNAGGATSHTFINTGTYNVTLQVENSKGCVSAVATKSVEINALPHAGFISPKACLTDIRAPFLDTTKINPGTIAAWQWNFGDANASAGNPNTSIVQNPAHQFATTGFYTTTLIVYSDKGCTDTVRNTFFVNGSVPLANFALQNNAGLCSNQPVSIKDASSVDVGSLVKLDIYWDYTNDPTIKLTDNNPTTGEIYTHAYPEFGSPASKTVTIRYVAYSGATCLNTFTRTITLLATPTLEFNTVAPVCENTPSFVLTQQAQMTNGLPGAGVFSGNGVSSAGLFNPATAGAGQHTITYTYTGTNGCSNVMSSIVEVNPKPGVNAGPDKFVLEGGTIMLTPAANASMPVTYLWTPPTSLSDPAIADPMASPGDDITYTLTVTSDKGCKVSDQVFVKVLKALIIPNIFSPNGDGVHDRWEIPYLESYPGCTVDIFNRYGQLVYHSVGYSKPWEGKVNGKDVPVGTYYYVIDPKNGRARSAGYVDVIR
ncbi:MAG TPA: PKD domain-containing protein [Chitinophagaceae bacterium]